MERATLAATAIRIDSRHLKITPTMYDEITRKVNAFQAGVPDTLTGEGRKYYMLKNACEIIDGAIEASQPNS
ncbi:MAG: hypothetical protein VXZ18_18990 [Pseudomonadota bacterium]|nr:hypothetical protein [Pseudomonadota bacterium]